MEILIQGGKVLRMNEIRRTAKAYKSYEEVLITK